MSGINFLKKILFLCLITFPITFFYTYSSEKIPGPDGNAVTNIEIFSEGGNEFKILSSNNILYFSKFDKFIGWSRSRKVYTFPTNNYIEDLTLKNNEIGNIRHCYVLSHDGSVYEFSYDINNDTFTKEPVIELPLLNLDKSYSKKLLVGNSYYMLVDKNLFTNQRDGKGWLMDTLGANNTVNSYCLDDRNTLYAAASKGVIYRNNDSDSFQIISTIDNSRPNELIYFGRNGILYVYNRVQDIRFSTDYGQTWSLDDGLGYNLIMKMISDDYGSLFAVTYLGGDYNIFRKKINSNWERIDSNIVNSTGISNKYYNDIAAFSTLAVGTQNGSFSSTDFGDSWTQTNDGIETFKIYEGFFLKNGTMIASSDFGVFKKNLIDSTWKRIFKTTSSNQQTIRIFKDATDNLYIAKIDAESKFFNYKSTDEGNTWSPDTLGQYTLPQLNLGNFNFCADKYGNEHLAFGFITHVYSRTPATGWKIDTVGLNLTVQSLTQTNVGNVYSDDNYLYLSLDYQTESSGKTVSCLFKKQLEGSTWTLDTLGLNNKTIYQFAKNKNGILYAATRQGLTKVNMFKFVNNRWNEIPLPSASRSYISSAIGIDSSNVLYISFPMSYPLNSKGSILATSDNGQSWMTAYMDNRFAHSLAAWNDTMFAFTDYSIFKLSKTPIDFPKIAVSPDTVDFGKVPTGRIAESKIKISNVGLDTLTVGIPDWSTEHYALEKLFSLTAGETKEVSLYFRGMHLGKDSLLFAINSNDRNYVIFLKSEAILTDSSAKYFLSKDTFDFGTVQTGYYKDTTVTIFNTGYDTLFVNNINSKVNVFSSFYQTFKVPPGEKFLDTIRFRPNTNGLLQGNFSIFSNILTDTIFVKGTGWIRPKPKLFVRYNTIDFGSVPIGTVKDTFFLISNTSTDTINITNLIGSSPNFTISPKKIVFVPGYNIIFYPSFQPTEEKKYNDFFEIIANDIPDTIFVKGTGIKPSGISENLQKSDFIISPNPATDFLEISVRTNGIRPVLNIEIFSVFGVKIQPCLTQTGNIQEGDVRLDVSGLPQGVYFLKIGNHVTKFVKI